MGVWRDLIGTVYDTLRIGFGKSTLDASAITAPRTHVLPNQSGTLALTSQLAGGTPATTVTVTFPASGSTVITQNVTVTGATIGQKVIASPSLDMPAGVAADELEMDMLTCAGVVIATDTVRLTVASIGGSHSGARNINLQLS